MQRATVRSARTAGICLLALAWISPAQQSSRPKVNVSLDTFAVALGRVVQASEDRFKSIRGAPLLGRDIGPAHDFRWQPTVILPGAKSCEITQTEVSPPTGSPVGREAVDSFVMAEYVCGMGEVDAGWLLSAVQATLGPDWHSKPCDAIIQNSGVPSPEILCFYQAGLDPLNFRVMVAGPTIRVKSPLPRTGSVAANSTANTEAPAHVLAPEQPRQPVTLVSGVMTAYDLGAKTITVRPSGGKPVTLEVQDKTSIIRLPRGETDPAKGIKITLSDVLLTDNLVAFSRGGVVSTVVVKTKERSRQSWELLSIAGTITNLNPDSRQFTVKTRVGTESKSVIVQTPPGTDFRRLELDSASYADAKPSTFAALKIGDQVRVLGDSGSERPVQSLEVLFGTLRTFAGTVATVDVAGKKIAIRDLDTGRQMEVRVSADSILKKLDPQTAAMMAYRLKRGEPAPMPGHARGSAVASPTAWLELLPMIAASELKPGDAVILTSTASFDGCVISLVAGVEPLIVEQSAPRGQRGSQLGEFLNLAEIPVPPILEEPAPSPPGANSSLPIQLSRSSNPVGANPVLTITNASDFPWQISFSGAQTLAVSLMPHSSQTVTFAPGGYFISGSTSAQNVLAFAPGNYTFPQDVTGTFTITVR